MAVDRRERILILLRTRDFGLPEPLRRAEHVSGFVHAPRERTCPDCLANGRVMKSCETCGGYGVVTAGRLAGLAVTDELPDDTTTTDPYAKQGVLPFGFTLDRHARARARDAEIERLERQTEPPRPEADLLAETPPFEWERERAKLRRNGDYPALDAALEALRRQHDTAYHVLHAVFVYGYQTEPSETMRRIAELGLAFIDRLMPDPIRVPSRFLPETEAQAEQIRRRTESGKAA